MGILGEIGKVVFKPLHFVMDGGKAVVSDAYNFGTSRTGRVVDYTGSKIGDILNTTGSVLYKTGDKAVELTGKALSNTRDATTSAAKFLGQKGTDAAHLIGDAARQAGHLAKDAASAVAHKTSSMAERGREHLQKSNGRTVDYAPTFTNPLQQPVEMMKDIANMGTRLHENISRTANNLLYVLYEGGSKPQPVPVRANK